MIFITLYNIYLLNMKLNYIYIKYKNDIYKFTI